MSMKRFVWLAVTLVVASLILTSATLSAPAPAYPEKGRPILLIVPYGAGGATDIQARILAPLLEKELGTPVEVLNKPAAGSQDGLTQIAQAKPDGYTIGYTLVPHAASIYLDPDRKAAFDRKSYQPIALHGADPQVVVVKADSSYRTLKELVDAANANPGKVTGVVAAILGDAHLAILSLQKVTQAKFAIVNATSGGAEPATMLLGGHVVFGVQSIGNWTAPIKNKELRYSEFRGAW
jgi:tripartite-type tricarboxylate transporter receptor subunit TctC